MARYSVGSWVWIYRPQRRHLSELAGWGTVTKAGRLYIEVEADEGAPSCHRDRFRIIDGSNGDPNFPIWIYPTPEAAESAVRAAVMRIEIQRWFNGYGAGEPINGRMIEQMREWGDSRRGVQGISDADVARLHALLVEMGGIAGEAE